MEKFEVIPGNKKFEVIRKIDTLADDAGYVVNYIETSDEKIRLQLWAEEGGPALGKSAHEAFLQQLAEDDEPMNGEVTSNYEAINIVVPIA